MFYKIYKWAIMLALLVGAGSISAMTDPLSNGSFFDNISGAVADLQEADCILPEAIDVELLDCETHTYRFDLGCGEGICVSYWQVDGGPALNTGITSLVYSLTPGTHQICVKMYCCNGSQAAWVCTDVEVPESCCVLPDEINVALLDCEKHSYQFSFDDCDICVAYWTIDGGPEVNQNNAVLVADFTPGYHQICCKVYCCSQGNAIWLCTDLYVPDGCGCVFPEVINVAQVDCDTYQFDLSGSSGVCVSYWRVDNGPELNWNQDEFTYSFTPGYHEICVKMYCCEEGGDAVFICTSIYVEECPCEFPSFMNVTVLSCPSHYYQFDFIDGTNNCVSYWSVDGGPGINNNQTVLLLPLSPGWHEICAKVYCCAGGGALWMCTNVFVPENCDCQIPTTISTTQIDCNTYQFDLDGSNFCVAYWQVDGGAAVNMDNTEFTESFTPGWHEICAKTYCCETGGSAFLCTSIYVEECPCVLPSAITATLIDCDSHTYQFNFADGDNMCVSYWSVDGGPEINQNNLQLTYNFSPGSHEICVKVGCCSGGDAIWLCTYIEVPEQCFCVLPTEIQVTELDCESHTYKFDFAGCNSGVCVSYWQVDGGPGINNNMTSLAYSFTPGWHEICAKVYCCEGGDAIWLCVNILVPEKCDCVLPEEINVTQIDCYKYQFDFDYCNICVAYWTIDGGPETNYNSPVLITDFHPGYHTICAKVYCCAGGEAIWLCVTIFVPECERSLVYHNQTHTGGVDFSAFPNPSSGLLNISFNSEVDVSSVRVHNAVGQLVSQQGASSDIRTMQLNIGNLPAGMYVISVETSSGSFKTSVVKE